MISLTKDKSLLGYESLSSYPNISHFVTTRRGGRSVGAYATFNCSPYTNDSANSVCWNQAHLFERMQYEPKELIIARQGHTVASLVIGDTYLKYQKSLKSRMLENIDALITNLPGYCVCVSTADCVPVLLYDKTNQVVAAIHAGWRGTAGRIVEKTLERMNELFATKGEDVIACIGPSISLESFEVGEEVYEAFLEEGFDMSSISDRKKETGKHHIDLWEANRMQLLTFGTPEHQIEISGICTYTHQDEFFSARRLGIESGRILSGIMLKETSLCEEIAH